MIFPGSSEVCGMDVSHISTWSARAPARFSASPGYPFGQVGIRSPACQRRPWVPQEHHQDQSQPHQPGGALKAQQPSPSRPVFYALCPSVIDFRHIHNISLSKVRHIAENFRFNATNYLFCCVRSFTCLFSSRICSTKADVYLYGSGVLCVLIGVSDTVSVILFH